MPAIERILCPIDYSECSRRALEQATALARAHGASLGVLHAFGADPASGDAPDGSPVALESAMLAALAGARPGVSGGHAPVDVDIVKGAAVEAILRKASAIEADLIVMGTHARNGFERLLFGSIADRVLHRALCPVLTVPAQSKTNGGANFSRVLFATNFSPSCEAAMQFASLLIHADHAHVFALHVLEHPEEQIASDWCRSSIPPAVRERAVIVERVAAGTAHQQILHIADEEACDLIVLGIKCCSPDLLLSGSTVKHVMQGARCAVLTGGVQTSCSYRRSHA